MGSILATGVPYPGANSGFDLIPVVAIVFVLLVARLLFRVRFTLPVLGACLLAGTAVSFGADQWGLSVSLLAALLFSLVIAAFVRLPRRQ